jgi:hypothetical protein
MVAAGLSIDLESIFSDPSAKSPKSENSEISLIVPGRNHPRLPPCYGHRNATSFLFAVSHPAIDYIQIRIASRSCRPGKSIGLAKYGVTLNTTASILTDAEKLWLPWLTFRLGCSDEGRVGSPGDCSATVRRLESNERSKSSCPVDSTLRGLSGTALRGRNLRRLARLTTTTVYADQLVRRRFNPARNSTRLNPLSAQCQATGYRRELVATPNSLPPKSALEDLSHCGNKR